MNGHKVNKSMKLPTWSRDNRVKQMKQILLYVKKNLMYVTKH